MDTTRKRKILERIQIIETDINELKRVRMEVGTNGYASATISSSGGSKSYTRVDLDKLTSLIKELQRELEQYRNLLADGQSNPLRTIVTIYS